MTRHEIYALAALTLFAGAVDVVVLDAARATMLVASDLRIETDLQILRSAVQMFRVAVDDERACPAVSKLIERHYIIPQARPTDSAGNPYRIHCVGEEIIMSASTEMACSSTTRTCRRVARVDK